MTLGGLTQKQLRRAVSVAQGLAEIEQLSDYPARAAALLHELIPADHAGYNAIDLECGRAVVVTDPADAVFEGGPEVLARYGHQNRLLAHHATVRDSRALRLSDLMSTRELHQTELYDHVYRLIPLEYQLAIQLSSPHRELGRPAELVGLSLGRERRDFSSADRQLLEAMRPQFNAVLERLRELALARALMRALDKTKHAFVLVGRDDLIVWADSGADALGLSIDTQLPWPLRHVANESVVTLGGRRMCASRIVEAYPQLDALQLRDMASPPSPDSLRAAGLTPRQAEVLSLAIAGLTTIQIAQALGLGPRGVEKHFERIYARLGVSNRMQAILRGLNLDQHEHM